ncbi:TIGR03086 family metal-binding protein [Streptomyces griseosporeus]|uniref:TIGR03086 family metal-binding protein n=1 Tax=Streptomyces griseosporeus TaxID=1910 RepID=UPI00167DCC4F|nr:TIGR03086 family metal-binding protein [Streptomyces griseosporeus]GHF88467.1 TIGR03086 family protein [Streptomyces griseosporeus]
MTDTSQTFDFAPQTRILARLVEGVRDGQLDDPTPCPGVAVRNMLGHVHGVAIAFRDAARKDLGPTTDTAPDATTQDVGPDWRAALPKALDELADAFRDPAAWTGMTRAGSVDLPGAVAAAVAVDELVVHGWDLARATGQEYEPDPTALRVSYDFLLASVDAEGNGIFGPVVPVPEDAPLLDRTVGLSGRDPGWTRQA